VVEIGWGLPLVWSPEALRSRIDYYHRHGIKASMSGTLLEYSVMKNQVEETLRKAKGLGFDLVEVSDGIIELTAYEKARLAERARSHGMGFLYAVGKKDPAAQPTPQEISEQLDTGLKLNPFKVVLEGRERGREVGIYDGEGNIRWNVLRQITAAFDYRDMIFEAPSELQQAALILELGPDVNLGNVSLGSVATLQSERLGLRFDTFGIDRPKSEIRAGPSTKFVLFAIRNYQPIDQKGIAGVTQLPRRTIQKALEYLVSQKLVIEHPSFEDRRSRIYRTPSYSPMEKVR
jgi:phosphosulfolactate synthase